MSEPENRTQEEEHGDQKEMEARIASIQEGESCDQEAAPADPTCQDGRKHDPPRRASGAEERPLQPIHPW